MKNPLIIVAAALLAVVPFLLFFGVGEPANNATKPGAPGTQAPETSPLAVEETQTFRLRSRENPPNSETPAGQKATDKSDSPPSPAISEAENTTKKSADSSKAVSRAVEAVKSGSPANPSAPGNGREIPEGSMKVGLVTGQSKLSSELAELAQRGAVAVSAKKWDVARDSYLEMVNQSPDNALAYANLGVAEHQLGNLLAAEGNLKKSLEINPSIAANWQTLGLISYERGELEMAISHLTRAIHEDPSDARTRVYLAAVIRSYGWIEASITELQRAVETDSELADAHFNLAVTYFESKPPRMELARRHYYAAVDLGAEPSPEMESAFSKDAEE